LLSFSNELISSYPSPSEDHLPFVPPLISLSQGNLHMR
jgi:hypothetical protein